MTPPGKVPFPTFDIGEINKLIQQRRSLFPHQFSGEKIDRSDIEQILANAHWAPTHGKTEPWHFIVFSGDALARLGKEHAELYRSETPENEFNQIKYDKLVKRPAECSHVIAICLKRGNNPKIPLIEEQNAVACAVQNIYLTATALGLAGYWSTGGMVYHPGMRDLLGLGPEDQCLGFFMLGRPKDKEHWPQGSRKTGWEEKVEWEE